MFSSPPVFEISSKSTNLLTPLFFRITRPWAFVLGGPNFPLRIQHAFRFRSITPPKNQSSSSMYAKYAGRRLAVGCGAFVVVVTAFAVDVAVVAKQAGDRKFPWFFSLNRPGYCNLQQLFTREMTMVRLSVSYVLIDKTFCHTCV